MHTITQWVIVAFVKEAHFTHEEVNEEEKVRSRDSSH